MGLLILERGHNFFLLQKYSSPFCHVIATFFGTSCNFLKLVYTHFYVLVHGLGYQKKGVHKMHLFETKACVVFKRVSYLLLLLLLLRICDL